MQLDLETLISAHSDSPVSPSAKQDYKKQSQMIGGSGMKLLEYYKLVNRNGSLLKMLKVLLVSKTAYSSKIVSLAWKLKVTKYNRLLFQLVPKTHHTKEIEYGSSDSLWPTPNAWDGKRGPRSQKNLIEKDHQINLITAVKDAQSPTPTKMWPTPRARDYKDGSSVPPSVIKGTRSATLGQEIAKDQAVGQLNSEWVTWLMGYPEGYLDISTENQSISQELPKEKKTEPKS